MKKDKPVTFTDIAKVIETEFSNTDIQEIKSLLVMDFVSLDLVKRAMRSYLKFSLGLLGNNDLVDGFLEKHNEKLSVYEIELSNLIKERSSRIVSKVLTAKLKDVFRKKSTDILDSITTKYQQAIRDGVRINIFKVCHIVPNGDSGKIKWSVKISKTI